MRGLRHAWGGYLVQAYIKPARSKEKAYEKALKNMTPDDWKWLLDEHFFNAEFLVSPQFVFSFCRKSLFLFAS